jgi:hypothetical protein
MITWSVTGFKGYAIHSQQLIHSHIKHYHRSYMCAGCILWMLARILLILLCDGWHWRVCPLWWVGGSSKERTQL